jgi:hypothetical protein
MTQTIEVESIRRLDIKPGEVLAVTLVAGATLEQADRVLDSLRAALPGVAVKVFEHGTRLDVLCPSSPA